MPRAGKPRLGLVEDSIKLDMRDRRRLGTGRPGRFLTRLNAVVDADFGVRTSDAVDASVSLDQSDGVPSEIEVDERAAVLEVLPFRKDIGTDEDVDLLGPAQK